MPSESVAGYQQPLPRELQADHSEFLASTAPLIERGALSAASIPRLSQYGHLVYTQAARLSLIAKGDRSSIYTRHVLDSLSPLSIFAEPPASAIDVGSGAGFPGIPLALAWPGTAFTLVESRERKAGFLERAVRELGIRNAKVVCGRLEEHGKSWRVPPQSAAFIRAVGSVPALLRILASICSPDARWVYFLGAGTSSEELIREVEASGHSATVEPGALGGRLLVGTLNRSGTPTPEG